jgi:circadian clock protein KaiC
VRKVRGIQFRGGYHDFRIVTGGIEVYPRVLQDEQRVDVTGARLLSDSKALDALLGGGLTCGTSTLITGAAGTGKSILSTQFARAELKRGKKVLFYLFDERLSTFRLRAKSLGMDVEEAKKTGQLKITQVEPTELSPGEFASQVVRAVEGDKCTLVIIDSINGYMQSMPEERLLPIQIHELLSFLSNHGVTCIMTLVQHGIFGHPVDEAVDVSYLADTVLLLRYFEVAGTVRQAISVVKNRSGDHERTIREYKVQKGGLLVGEPLTEFQGVLTGVPHYTGSNTPLIAENGNFANGVIDQSSEAGERAKDGVREHARKRGRKKSSC